MTRPEKRRYLKETLVILMKNSKISWRSLRRRIGLKKDLPLEKRVRIVQSLSK